MNTACLFELDKLNLIMWKSFLNFIQQLSFISVILMQTTAWFKSCQSLQCDSQGSLCKLMSCLFALIIFAFLISKEFQYPTNRNTGNKQSLFLYLLCLNTNPHSSLCFVRICRCLYHIVPVCNKTSTDMQSQTTQSSYPNTLLIEEEKKSLVLIISILWACLFAQNRHLSNPPFMKRPQTSPSLMERTFW